MKIKNLLNAVLPPSVKTILKGDERKKETLEVKSLRKKDCDTNSLLSEDKVELNKIFHSEESHFFWASSSKDIARFNIPDFTGGVNPGDRRALFYLIKYFKPKKVLEIGTHIGASTIHIASALHKNQLQDDNPSFLKTLDIKDVNSLTEKPWLQNGTEYSPAEMIKLLQFDAFVEFVTNTSLDFFEKNTEKFDFIFLDGSHSGKTVYEEIPLALKKLNKDGIILLHDYFPNGIPLWSDKSLIAGPYVATDRHIRDGADITILPLGDLPWPTKLGSSTTSLALLLKKS